jgi:FkbH-like protein
MGTFVFRNYTIEHFFESDCRFSGYGEVQVPNNEFDDFLIFYQINPEKTEEGQISEIEEIKSKIKYLLAALPHSKRIAIFTFKNEYGQNWEMRNPTISFAINDFNHKFLPNVANDNRVKIIRIESFFENISPTDSIDWKYLFTSQIIINPKLAKEFKRWFKIQLNALNLVRKKCIILDCDNTLWGGVVGEDGIAGIKLGEDYPGVCYVSFQKLLAEAASRGVILAVVSKNNEADITEVWQKHHKNILNSSHFASFRINWDNKIGNIKSVADELNISTDSMVFFDDNPVERDLVKKYLPEVIVPDFPAQPYELVKFFWNVYNKYFFTYSLSKEDLNKAAQYKENVLRESEKNSFENLDEYLNSLRIEVNVLRASESNISRIAQMTQKTNQFNLTTRRYTEERIRELISSGAYIYCADVKDKFGDNGITVAGIFVPSSKETIEVDSYLLSCRILGRKIEIATMQYILNHFRYLGYKEVNARFIPTSKNLIAADYLESLGFELSRNESGTKHYHLNLAKEFHVKNYYKIAMNGKED